MEFAVETLVRFASGLILTSLLVALFWKLKLPPGRSRLLATVMPHFSFPGTSAERLTHGALAGFLALLILLIAVPFMRGILRSDRVARYALMGLLLALGLLLPPESRLWWAAVLGSLVTYAYATFLPPPVGQVVGSPIDDLLKGKR
jgi:hypothetical protein